MSLLMGITTEASWPCVKSHDECWTVRQRHHTSRSDGEVNSCQLKANFCGAEHLTTPNQRSTHDEKTKHNAQTHSVQQISPLNCCSLQPSKSKLPPTLSLSTTLHSMPGRVRQVPVPHISFRNAFRYTSQKRRLPPRALAQDYLTTTLLQGISCKVLVR